MGKYFYFKQKEIEGLDAGLVTRLDAARHDASVPFIITSGIRSAETNEAAKGVAGSSHLEGLAVDLRVGDSRERFLMVTALLKVGFKRIGLYTKHLHVDLDLEKPQDVIWLGGDSH